MAISTPGVGGGTPDFKLQGLSKDFWGELKFSISGPLGGSKSFASILFVFFWVGILSDSPTKSGPLDFGTKNNFTSFFVREKGLAYI